jgi:hypothetical protein
MKSLPRGGKGGTNSILASAGKYAALKAAGISTSAAHRCEKLAAIPAATSCQRFDSVLLTENRDNVSLFPFFGLPALMPASASIAPALRSDSESSPAQLAV